MALDKSKQCSNCQQYYSKHCFGCGACDTYDGFKKVRGVLSCEDCYEDLAES